MNKYQQIPGSNLIFRVLAKSKSGGVTRGTRLLKSVEDRKNHKNTPFGFFERQKLEKRSKGGTLMLFSAFDGF